VRAAIWHYPPSARDSFCVGSNCGAIPPSLLGVEAVRHEKGAFTLRITSQAGASSWPQGGTLFLVRRLAIWRSRCGSSAAGLQGGTFECAWPQQWCKRLMCAVIAGHAQILEQDDRAARFPRGSVYGLHVSVIEMPQCASGSRICLYCSTNLITRLGTGKRGSIAFSTRRSCRCVQHESGRVTSVSWPTWSSEWRPCMPPAVIRCR